MFMIVLKLAKRMESFSMMKYALGLSSTALTEAHETVDGRNAAKDSVVKLTHLIARLVSFLFPFHAQTASNPPDDDLYIYFTS